MSTKTAMICTKCKEVLNSEDDIFGTSCGHLYHFLCLRECHGRTTNCSHCESYKPCIYKMFLEFGEAVQPINWEDQTKTIELHNELEESKVKLINLEEKYKFSQVSVQKLEGKLKKHNDALKSKDITISDLEERITTLEDLNKYLTAQLELKIKNNNDDNNSNKTEESDEQNGATVSKNQMKKINSKKIQHLTEQLEEEIAKNSIISVENMKLKALLNFANNENGINTINLAEHVFASGQTSDESINETKENGNHVEEIVSDTETIAGTQQNTENKISQEIDEQPSPASSNQENTNDSHTIIIRNYSIQDLKGSLESVIIEIASRMDIKLTHFDIIRVIKIKNNFKTVSLIVAFQNIKFKQMFLKNKTRLKKNKFTKYLEICASTK